MRPDSLTPGASHVSAAKSNMSFAPEVVEELERTNPQLLMWLRSTCGILFQGSLIFLYVFLETIGGLLISFVLKPDPPPKFKPMPSSIIVLNSGLSIIIGLMTTTAISVFSEKTPLVNAASKTIRAVFQWRAILSYSLVAACFSISAVFSLTAYSRLDAGLKKILDQLRLPLTAGLGVVIVGKKYSGLEWLALLIVPLAVCSFYVAAVEHDEVTELHTRCRHPQNCFSETAYDLCALRVDGPTVVGTAVKDEHNVSGTRHEIISFEVKASHTDSGGLFFSLVATLFNCMGSLLQERLLKKTASTPFPTQKAQVEITGFPVALAMSFIVPLYFDTKGGKAIWWTKTEAEGSGEGFFQGYTALTCVVIALDILLAWMSGIICKRFSSLVQKLSKCFILLLTVFCTGTFLKPCQADPLPLTMYSLAFITAAATILFATMPKDEATPQPQSETDSTGVRTLRPTVYAEQQLTNSALLLRSEGRQ